MQTTEQIAHIAKSVQENFFAHKLFLPEHLSSCSVLKAQELIIINSHVATAKHNAIIRARLNATTVAHAISSALAYFKREGVTCSWWVAPDDTPEHMPELLRLNGLTHHTTYYALVVDMHEAETQQVELMVERIIDDVQLEHALSVLYQVHGDAMYTQQWYKQLLNYNLGPDDYERWYIAYRDDQPVAVGALTLYANIVGFYEIAIAHTDERMHIHRAFIIQLLDFAQTLAVSYASVVCTQEELSFYRSLGFDDLLTFERFSSES